MACADPNESNEHKVYKDIVANHKRDINCLYDPNRRTRKMGLQKIYDLLQSDKMRSLSVNAQNAFFNEYLLDIVLKIIQDPVEKCREMGIKIAMLFVPSNELLEPILRIVHERMGKVPFVETSEEIRLLLLELVNACIVKGGCDKVLKDDMLANVLTKALQDAFPESKRACVELLLNVAKVCPEALKFNVKKILSSLIQNLNHQHSKVRCVTVNGIDQLVRCGTDHLENAMNEMIVPALKKLLFDRTASVRKELVLLLASWFVHLEQIERYRKVLFPILLATISDDSVSEFAVLKMNELGVLWEANVKQFEEVDEQSIFGFADIQQGSILPFLNRPHPGARAMGRFLLPTILDDILTATSDWTVLNRARATDTLRVLLILAEDKINAHLQKILSALAKRCTDDEPTVIDSLAKCVAVIGRFADNDALFATLIPMATGVLEGQDTVAHRTNGLQLLSMSIQGIQSEQIEKHMPRLTSALVDPEVLKNDVPELQEQLVSACQSIVQVGQNVVYTNAEFGFRLFWALSQVIASSPPDADVHAEAVCYLQRLVASSSIDEVYHTFTPMLLQHIVTRDKTGKFITWGKNDANRELFDSLCRRGGKSIGENISTIVPVIHAHCQKSLNPDIHLVFLALLETLLGDANVHQSFIPHATVIILECILPHLIWKGGCVAATIRKIAMACMYTTLLNRVADRTSLFDTAPKVLPVLQGCLDDDDGKTRQLVCLSMQHLFDALPGTLSAEPVQRLYPEILKRLDDSNNTVRATSCGTMISFLRAVANKNDMKGTMIQYTLDCLFLHLDDSEMEIQDAVCPVILELAMLDPDLVKQKAMENKSIHRNPNYCDLILSKLQ